MFFGNLGWKKPEKSNSVLFVILVFPHIDFPRAEIYCDVVVVDGDDDNESDKESKKQSSTSFNNPMIRFLLYLLIFIIAINYTSYSKEELSSMEEE